MRPGNWKIGIVIPALAICFATMVLGGCKTIRHNVDGAMAPAYNPRDFVPEESRPAGRNSNPVQMTSLWSDNNRENWLFTDHKARNVNDIVTIKIYESSSAKKKAKTKLDNSNSADLGITGLFGLENAIPKIAPEVNMGSLFGASTKRNFSGNGETERSGELAGTMSALVTQVLTNGNLMIEGKRLVQVNNEEQVMVLSGMIRPRDINADNSIASYMIADARIFYSGQGVIANKQKPGWLSRGIDKVSPF